jgi:demethylmenaquinone methyltransferase/2-methoxy-6-polyprenyl-1,4-benzoquinol methylase
MYPMVRARLDKSPKDVAAMFDQVAKRYDVLNDLLSLGRTKAWRKVVVSTIAPRPGMRILDCAAGTGSSTAPLAAAGASAFASDFSLGMLEAGARRERELPFIAADNLALPFADNAFDVVTISFGLRNVANTKSALEEAHRVCAPGGRLVVCEFSHPTNRLFRTIYFRYLMRVLPPLARAFSSNPDAYTYLAESIEAWPNQSALAEIISQAGWSSVAWQNRTGGIVAIHSAFKAFKG